MGLTIHYSGRFRENASLSGMMEEVVDIANTNKWKYHLFAGEFPAEPEKLTRTEILQNRYGLMLLPPLSEPVHLYFNALRHLGFLIAGQPDPLTLNKKDPSSYLPMNAQLLQYGGVTKTEFAGPDIHIKIINLIRYIFSKYLIHYQVFDEGNYWESNDEDRLRKTFTKYSKAYDTLQELIKGNCKEPDESTEEYLLRIKKIKGRESK